MKAKSLRIVTAFSTAPHRPSFHSSPGSLVLPASTRGVEKSESNADTKSSSSSRSKAYKEAWRIRTQLGHHAAVSHYKQILSTETWAACDTSAATRIAASDESLLRLDQLGRHYAFRALETQNLVANSAAEWERDIGSLRTLLENSGYNHSTIRQSIFNLPVGPYAHMDHHNTSLEQFKNAYPMGPIYARSLQPGHCIDAESLIGDSSITSEEPWKSSLQCLTILFVLSSCIPKYIFIKAIDGGENSLNLLLRLGLVFLYNDPVVDSQNDYTKVVPLVHLFPLEISELIEPILMEGDCDNLDNCGKKRSLTIMTDLHPSVLGLTSIPNLQSIKDSSESDCNQDGVVMYIGPDSLALIHHLHASFLQYWNSKLNQTKRNVGSSSRRHDEQTPVSSTALPPFKVLDLCTGSGVHALAMLSMLELVSDRSTEGSNVEALAVAVDVNQRALRFTDFNAMLNGYSVTKSETEKRSDDKHSPMKMCTLNADLISSKVLSHDDASAESTHQSLVDEALYLSGQFSTHHSTEDIKFDVLLANPPFIPVPPKVSDKKVLSVYGSIGNAKNNTPIYGLFSSGGESGEECLQAIVQTAPNLLRKDALVAIVSEFMNPSTAEYTGLDPMFRKGLIYSKLEKWWNHFGSSLAARGVLFTNEHAIPSATYAERRAIPNDANDVKYWERHLNERGIHCVSPGLLFLRVLGSHETEIEALQIQPMLVPKSKHGSIWTPHNYEAVELTRSSLANVLI